MKTEKLSATLFLSFILAACGGGGGGGSSTTTPTTPDTTLPPPDTSIPTTSTTRTGPSGCTLAQLTGGQPDKGLTISEASWVQVVQQNVNDSSTILAGGKATLLRVDVTATVSGRTLPADAKLIVGNPTGSLCHEYTLTSSAMTAPTTIDRSTLAKSYVVTVPAADVQPGMTYQVMIDGNNASTAGAASRLYIEGSVSVKASQTEQTLLIPITFDGVNGAAPPAATMAALLLRSMPHASSTMTDSPAVTLSALNPADATLIGGVYYFSEQKMSDAHVEFDSKCHDLVGSGQPPESSQKCVGFFPPNVVFGSAASRTTGRAFVGGFSMIMESFSTPDNLSVNGPYGAHWLLQGATTFIHEYGHLMGLNHANCGVSGPTDDRLYTDGSLGNGAGYDSERDFYFYGTTGNGFSDIMSYCGKGWMSDKGYRAVIDYKINGGPAATAAPRMSGSNRTVRFTFEDGHWVGRLVYRPSLLIPSSHLDAAFINNLLTGLPVSTLDSDEPPSVNGPFYVDISNNLLNTISPLMKRN